MKKKLNYLLYACILVLVSSLAYVLFGTLDNFYPDEKIQNITKQYVSNFEKNAKSVEIILNNFQTEMDRLNLDSTTQKMIIDKMIFSIESGSLVKGLILLEHGKKLTIIEKNQNSFAYAVDSSSLTNNVQWRRINKDQEVLNSWTTALGVELNILSSGEDSFNDSYKYNLPIWTPVHRLLENSSKNRNVAVHITWRSAKTNNLVSCIALLDEFNSLLLLPFKSKALFQSYIVNVNEQLFPFSGSYTNDTSVVSLNKNVRMGWEAASMAIPTTFNFGFQDLDLWAHALNVDIEGINAILLVVEENTLRLSIVLENWIELLVIFISLILIITILLLKRNAPNSIQTYIEGQKNDIHASQLIQKGEDTYLEFKSSFRYDYNQETVNKDLELVIAKSIAAFSNGKGGTLLIGINDNGDVLGLDKDINTFKRKDIDFFENFLRAFLNKAFSLGFVANNLDIKFPVVDHKIICRIDIKAGAEPVFVEMVKKSTKMEKFYVRSGNTSMEMGTLSEINKYIQDRF